jgi:hypothetical protein
VSEEPSGFHAASKDALDLISRDALLAGAHQMDDLQPQMQQEMRGLKNGPDAHGKGLAAFLAVIKAAAGGLAFHLLDALGVNIAAMRANGTVRPKSRLDKSESGVFILEAIFGKNRAGHSEISYGLKSTPCGALCQV